MEFKLCSAYSRHWHWINFNPLHSYFAGMWPSSVLTFWEPVWVLPRVHGIPKYLQAFYFPSWGTQYWRFFFSFVFCFLTPRFYVLKVTFGSRRARCEDYWVRQLGCLYESELANQTQETQTGFNQYYSYWTFWKEASRRPARRPSIISSLGGLAGTLVAVFHCSLPHTGTRCESQGMWVTLSQSGHYPHQSCIWFSSSLRSACQLADPQAQVFVSHNVEGETTVPPLS